MSVLVGLLFLSGYFAEDSSVQCPQTCASSNIVGTEICNATSKECSFGCKDGYYGVQCENRCNDSITYCKICTIQNNSSVTCDECLSNFYKYNGKCKQCNYWCGINMSSPLPTCRISDGYCNFGCRAGHYGFSCASRCSSTCKDICDRDTGHCLTGCKYQSYCGPTCELSCSDGCASHNCEQSCTCRLGCTRKKWGDKCDKFCNVNCNEPPDLKSNICERSNGSCSYKCKNDTFWGSQCDKQYSSKCTGGTCEQATGNCTGDCNSKEVYGMDYTNIKQVAILGSGWLLSLVLIVVLIVIAIRRQKMCKVCCDKGSAKDNQREMAGTIDRLQQAYTTLEEESSSSKSPDMYVTLNRDQVCKHGKNLREENLRRNRIQNDYTAKQTANIYDVPNIETEYLNLKIEKGNTGVFAKEVMYVNVGTNDV